MGDKGEGRVKNLKKWVISFMDGSLLAQLSAALFWYYPKATSSIWNFEIIFSFMILAMFIIKLGLEFWNFWRARCWFHISVLQYMLGLNFFLPDHAFFRWMWFEKFYEVQNFHFDF